MTATEWNPGDKVSLRRWDATESPMNQMGDSIVLSVMPSKFCLSGQMAVVRNAKGDTQKLDVSWLEASS